MATLATAGTPTWRFGGRIDVSAQALQVADVRSVVITPVVQDEESGEYVREVRIFGGDPGPVPPILNSDIQPPGVGNLLLTLRLTSATRRRIGIAIPELEF
jgi:hypothetical protein